MRIPGAGEGNRTLVVSLEGFCSTIELHPPSIRALPASLREFPDYTVQFPTTPHEALPGPARLPPILSLQLFLVEGEGFEPSKAEPSDLQSDPFDRSGTPPNETADYR
jgi:hypothetical protein